MRRSSQSRPMRQDGQLPSTPVNTYAVAIGMLLIAGIAFARVGLSAQITKYGYRLDGLRCRQLELLEENRSLKVEVGTRQSATQMLGKLEARGETMVRYDEARVVTVETEMDIAVPPPDDAAARFARQIADIAYAGLESAAASRPQGLERMTSPDSRRMAESSK